MSSFEIAGKLHKKFDTEQKTSNFEAREFVIEIQDGNYSQYIKFQLVQDRCALIDNYEEGDQIKVHFNLRGREWNDKYFTNLNAWRIEAEVQEEAATKQPLEVGTSTPFPTTSDEPPASFDDDLPF